MTPSTHQHSSLRAIGVDIACFVVGMAALLVGYYIAGWLGAVVTAALAVAAITREAKRPFGLGVAPVMIAVLFTLIIMTFGYRIIGWPAVVIAPILLAIGARYRERNPYTRADHERDAVLREMEADPWSPTNPSGYTNPWSPLNPIGHSNSRDD